MIVAVVDWMIDVPAIYKVYLSDNRTCCHFEIEVADLLLYHPVTVHSHPVGALTL